MKTLQDTKYFFLSNSNINVVITYQRVCIRQMYIGCPASHQQFGTFTNQAKTPPAVQNEENCKDVNEHSARSFMCILCKCTFEWKTSETSQVLVQDL